MISKNLKSLGEISESIRYGYTASACEEPVGPHFLRITDIVSPQINWEGVPYCQIEEKDRQKFSLQPGDIVIARTGGTVGYAKLIRDNPQAVFASYLVRVRVDPHAAVPGYVGRIVESNVFKRFVASQVGGSAQPNANAKILSSFRLPIPDWITQHRIVEILSAYDDLIENNRRRIQLLEESARLLYREWFVHLRFPGHEHVKVVDGVPEGWERIPLGDLVDVNRKSLKAGFEGTIQYIDLASVSEGKINEPLITEFKEAPGRARRVVSHGDVIWGGVRPNQRSHALIWDPPENLIVSTGFIVITPKFIPSTFLYHLTTTNEFVSYLTNIAQGAAYPAAKPSDFKDAKVVVPPKAMQEEFHDYASAIFKQIDVLSRQNQKLAEARDLLLPRLMNGEIAV